MLTFLERLEALKSDLELVLVGEFGGVVENLDAEEGNDRHGGLLSDGACVVERADER